MALVGVSRLTRRVFTVKYRTAARSHVSILQFPSPKKLRGSYHVEQTLGIFFLFRSYRFSRVFCYLTFFFFSYFSVFYLQTLSVLLPFLRPTRHRNWSTSSTSCLPVLIVFRRYIYCVSVID